jgi:uncharacterized protein (TIGR02466 family)
MIYHLFPVALYMNTDPSQIDLCQGLFTDAETYFDKAESGFLTTLQNYSPASCAVSWDPLPLKKTKPLVDFIKQHVANYLSEGKYKNYECEVVNLWFNKMFEKTVHPAHTHYGYSLSGVYHVQVPGTSAKLMLHNPADGTHHQKFDALEYVPHNSYTWWVNTEPGSVILFPSWLKHSVPAEEFEGERRSIAFDVILRPIKQLKAT